MKKQKKKRGWKIVLAVILVLIVYSWLQSLKTKAGNAAYYFIVILIYAIIIWLALKIATANAYMKKYKFHVVALNNGMNDSYDLETYYTKRDELIAHLGKMAKGERWLNQKNRLSEKPSSLLRQLSENENLHVHTVILRMTAHFKCLVRENGPGFSKLFSEQIEKYSSRLSPENLNDAKLCLRILEDYETVAGRIEETDGMEGHTFEHWCADLLLKNGFTDVEVTPGSGDQGVDVVAIKDGINYAIQCKCYSSDLGNKPVQEVHAGKNIYHCQVGAVMTNRYFTSGAKELAEATGVLLWDRDKLMEMLDHK